MQRRYLFLVIIFLSLLFGVHFLYIGLIDPLAQQAIDLARAQGQATPRTFAVLLKDPEQEICIIFALFCAVLMADRCYRIYSQRYLFEVDLFQTSSDTPERPSLEHLDGLEDGIKESPLVRTMMACIRRFDATSDVQSAADVVDSNIESTSMKLESENSMIKYLIWSIPSIGFVGTVRGIGLALSEADKALNGDIAGVTASLGVAFNSTLVALVLSIILTAVLHVMQNQQDKLIMDIEGYCDRYLIKRLTLGQSGSAV